MDRGLTYDKIFMIFESLRNSTDLTLSGNHGTIEFHGLNRSRLRDLGQYYTPEMYKDHCLQIKNERYEIFLGDLSSLPEEDFVLIEVPGEPLKELLRVIEARTHSPLEWVSGVSPDCLDAIETIAIFRPRAKGFIWKYIPSRCEGVDRYVISRQPVFEEGYHYGAPHYEVGDNITYIPLYQGKSLFEFIEYEGNVADTTFPPKRIIRSQAECMELKERLQL